jgi:sugar lactone lactonase YvrE
MRTGRVLRLEPGGLELHADLSGLARGVINDMISRRDGTLYVGDMGARIFDDQPDYSVPGQLLKVSPSGAVSVVWDDLRAPNGLILTDDERTLIVAESGGMRLTAFDIGVDGSLSEMRVFAELRSTDPAAPISVPDGICLDTEGAVWAADPLGRRVVRIRRGGEITDEIHPPGLTPVACVLGNADRKTLFICAAAGWTHRDVAHTRTGCVLAIQVGVAGCGAP